MMRAHSSIFNFKFKWIKRLLVILFLCVIVLAMEQVWEYYVNTPQNWERVLMHEFYLLEENIDYLYLGSSHVFGGVDPAILDEETGKNNFDLATTNQNFLASYYLLKEADKRHDLQHVFLECYYAIHIDGYGNYKADDNLPMSWRVLDNLSYSLNKFEFMMDLSSYKNFYLSLFPSRRQWETLLEPEEIRKVWTEKQTEEYLAYEYVRERSGYVDMKYPKGFYYSNGIIPNGSRSRTWDPVSGISKEPLTEDAKEYLGKIISYCAEHDIELTLFSVPVSDFQLAAEERENYDFYREQLSRIAEENGIEYVDFNLCKEEYLDLGNDELWRDEEHLNVYGAADFTRFFASYFFEQEQWTDKTPFYASYAEKLSQSEERIYGLTVVEIEEKEAYGITDVGVKGWEIQSVDNLRSVQAEYQVGWIVNGEEILVQEWDTNNIITVPEGESGALHILARKTGDEEATNEVILEY